MSVASVSGLQKRLEALLQADRKGLSPVQVDDILEAVCVHAQELLAGEGACVTVYQAGEDALELRACSGILEEIRGLVFPVEDSVSGTALLEGRPLFHNDLGHARIGKQARALPVEIHRAVSVPLPGWKGKLGTLVVVRGKESPEFAEPDQRLLSAYAVPTALALRSAEKFAAEQERAREEEARLAHQEEYIRRLKALHDAGLLVASETELEELLQTITRVARAMTKAQYGALGILDREGKGLVRFITEGLSEEERTRHGTPPVGEGLLGALIRERRPIRISGAEMAGSPSVDLPTVHHVPDSFLGVPISIGQRVFGNLYLTNKKGQDGFTVEDQVLVEMLAAQAAVAIEKAEVFEEREELIRRLETARGLRTRLSAYVNHDIRNALGGVALWAERLEGRIREREEAQELGEMAQKIRRGATHALRLVKDVLDLTRLEEGRLEVWPRQVRVLDLVHSALDGVRPEAERKAMRLEFVPEDPELNVVADPDRVHQIVLNLLSNAVKFSPEGSTVRVRSLASSEGPGRGSSGGSWIRIDVEDEGPGIRPEDVDRIFGVYERARGEEGRREGLGIGLTLSRHLAELMGGAIEVSPEPSQGACFSLWLPVGKEPERRPGWIG